MVEKFRCHFFAEDPVSAESMVILRASLLNAIFAPVLSPSYVFP